MASEEKDQLMGEPQSGLTSENAFSPAKAAAPGFPVLESPYLPAMLDAPAVPRAMRRAVAA